MADQMINGLPVKTTTQAGDKALISGVTEEYLIDIDKLADIVLSKLTNKNFALDQGTMTLLAALNALNSKFAKMITPGYKSEFWQYSEGCKDRATSIPPVVVCIGDIVFLYLYFKVESEDGIKIIGTLDKSIAPKNFTTVVAVSFKGQGYPLLIHPRTYNLYSDVLLPADSYCMQAVWVKGQ